MKNKSNLNEDDIKFLFNELRKASIVWKGREEILKSSSKKVFVRRAKNGNSVYKLHWQCNMCEQWFRNKSDMEVDHIDEIGGITGFTGDWNETINKIFPRPVEKYLQCLCVVCHLRKTKAYMAAAVRYKRKK